MRLLILSFSIGCCPAFGPRNLYSVARGRRDTNAANYHALGARGGNFAPARLFRRGGRFCRQALLNARVDGARACFIATQPGRFHGPLLTRGDLQLNRETRRVRRGLRNVRLRRKEFGLLECILERPGGIFSRRQLLDHVWGQSADIDDRAVDVYCDVFQSVVDRLRARSDPHRARDGLCLRRGVRQTLILASSQIARDQLETIGSKPYRMRLNPSLQ